METLAETSPKRRSRMSRQSTGKRLELTRRDLDIFQLLERYRFLRSSFIHAFVGGNKTKLLERLGHLYHEGGYLDRPAQQWQCINARYQPVVYETTPRAREVLRDHGLCDGDAITPLHKGPQRQFAHALMICEIIASIELGARQNSNLRFIAWPEILAKAPEATRLSEHPLHIPVSIAHPQMDAEKLASSSFKLVPDGIFGLEYQNAGSKSYRFFALEADRDTMPVMRAGLEQSSYFRKFLAYRHVAAVRLYKSHFGLPNLLVLSVTINEMHQRNIMQALEKLGGGPSFLFKTIPGFGDAERVPQPMLPLLSGCWERVGCEPLRIDLP